MLDSINQFVEDICKLEIKQQDAHMRALQAQINPHFLYNTLEYIRMYALSEGSEELADVVDLSQYLGHILVETVKPFFLLLILQIPVGLDSESSYGFDFGYKILQCS